MEEMQTQRIYLAALVYNRTGVLLRGEQAGACLGHLVKQLYLIHVLLLQNDRHARGCAGMAETGKITCCFSRTSA